MTANDTIELEIWKGDWGLPSVDIYCLQVLTVAKLSGIPVKVNPTSNPFRTPNGHLPVLSHGSTVLDNVRDIIEYLRKHNSPDTSLKSKQNAEIVAYENMLKEKVYPALQYIWWIDQQNLNEVIRPWYAKALPFPLNFYYPHKYEKQAKQMMESLYPTEDNITAIENTVYSEAQKCLTTLSTRLGDFDYFLGSQPTTLDAVIYSYLAPVLKAPLINVQLQNHLKACTNLSNFVTRITLRCFEGEYKAYEKLRAQENVRNLRRNSETEIPNKRRNQFLAGIFATAAMVGYAISTGIVEVPIRNDEILEAPAVYMFKDGKDDD